ncbi:transposase [Priestia aryabhattai]|nr:transposase [Priestia aryabhattai]
MCDKYDPIGFNTGNLRNGSYKWMLPLFGKLHLVIPSDRNKNFKKQTVAPYKRARNKLEAFFIYIFQNNV